MGTSSEVIRLWAPDLTRGIEGAGLWMDVRVGELERSQVRALVKKYNRYAWEAVHQAKLAGDLGERRWWYGKSAGFLDAIMMLDGSYDLIEEVEKEVGI